MTRQNQDNSMDALESLLSEALSPEIPSDDLAARIIASTSPTQQSDQPNLRLVGQQQVSEYIDRELEPILDHALAPGAVPSGLVKRIVDATKPMGDHVIARIGPMRLRYSMAKYIAAAVIIAASWGIVFQAMGIFTDAFHIVQATRHVSSIMKYTAPDTVLDQQIDQLSNELDKLALGSNHDDWNSRFEQVNESLSNLDDLLDSDS
ncbi:MAG TPA: hypothetical protein DCM28_15510 [Phycisphaerales bacterium]|nr:hypothetical protein [Phycisphaerales bacterium]